MIGSYNPIASNTDNPTHRFAPLVERWRGAIRAALAHRKKEFDDVADEARNFFDGPANYMWTQMAELSRKSQDEGFLAGGGLMPQFRFSTNRMFDAVAMFGPALYAQNPTVAASPRRKVEVSMETAFAADPQATEVIKMIPALQAGVVEDPQLIDMAMMLQDQYDDLMNETERLNKIAIDHATILESLANYYQNETNKQDEARLAINEAIVTGLGLLEFEFNQMPAGGPRVPASRFISNRDLIVDPDATLWKDVTWIGLRRVRPVNIVEEKFGLPPGSLKGKFVSNTAMTGDGSATANRGDKDGYLSGRCHDLVEYWDIYSKNGAGQNLKIGDSDRKIQDLDSLGDYIYLAICPSCPYPLNLPGNQEITSPETGEADEKVLEATSWPAPYWDDIYSDGGWPISRLFFYSKPGHTWPISMCKPVLPKMKFINWCMSFLADGVAVGSKIYVATVKSAAESIRTQIAESRGPFTTIELESLLGKNINEIVSFLKAPDFNIDIWKMVSEVNQDIDKTLGLTELLYGLSSRQMRSAAEATYRQENINIRPDDMASKVEDWLSIAATRELQVLRYRGTGDDVMPIIGPLAASVYESQILTQDVSALTREFSFRIESGSARKPNKDTRIAQLSEIAQYLLPFAQNAVSLGITRPWNAFMEDYGTAMDIDPQRYMLTDEEQQMVIQQQMMMNQPPPTSGE